MITIPGRIPIRIFPFFWILILVIGWLNTSSPLGIATWGIIIFISVIIHEYGHALTALAFGQQAEIDLIGMGGVTKRSGPQLKKWQEFIIVLNGPCAGFILYFLASMLFPLIDADRFKHLSYAVEVAKYINLFWSILNLIPIMPMDGGHLMRIALEGMFGFKGLKIALIVSIVLAIAISLLFFFVQSLLGGALFLMLAFESYRAFSEIKDMTSQDAHMSLQELLQGAQDDVMQGNNNEAFSKLLLLREQTKEGFLYVKATENIARILANQGHFKQAYEWLIPIENQLSPDYLYLLQQLAYRLQNWENVIKIGNKAYQVNPLPDVALLNSFANTILGKTTPAVGWLRCAIQSGIPDIPKIIQSREFDVIRHTPEFESLIRTLSL